MNIQKVKINSIKLNPNNPRLIKDDKFKKLVKSIQDFPEMLDIRPIVVNSDMIILGGNMRYKACKEAGLKEIPIIVADNLTEEQQKEFLIKDNVSGGEWDFDILLSEWNSEELESWGVDMPNFNENTVLQSEKDLENPYTAKVDVPLYETNNEIPVINELFDKSKYEQLLIDIEDSDLEENIKNFLRISASRHIVFNYSKIADFYAHSNEKIQELMEDSALVIIDFNKAIENGFVKLTNEIIDMHNNDY